MQEQLDYTLRGLLGEPWILDADATVKPLYSQQEGAVAGYNAVKPDRPSHTYHSFMVANLRLMLEVEVMPGNKLIPKRAAPTQIVLLERLGPSCQPSLLRGDNALRCGRGDAGSGRRNLPYLFRLRLTANVQRAIKRAMLEGEWADAGHGWQGQSVELRLQG